MFLFITEICWVFIQTRRQDFAAGGNKNYKRGKYFLKTILDVCSNRGTKYEMGAQVLNGGRAPLAPLVMALFLLYEYGLFWCAIWVYLKSLNGSPAYDC